MLHALCPMAVHVSMSWVQLLGMQQQQASCAHVQVVEAFKILTSDKQVKAILVNIFGTHPLPLKCLSMGTEIIHIFISLCPVSRQCQKFGSAHLRGYHFIDRAVR